MKVLKKLAGLIDMAMGAGAVWLAVLYQRAFSSVPAIFNSNEGHPKTFIAVLATLGVALVLVAYDFGFRRHDA